jgi:RHS repeat-associated protein
MRLSLHLRLTTWLLLVSYLNLLCPVSVLCAELDVPALSLPNGHAVNPSSPPAPHNSQPSTLSPQPSIKPNHTLPAGVVQSIPAIEFSSTPTDGQIFRARIFPEPLVSFGQPTTPGENTALAQAITHYLQPGTGGDLTVFTDFLAKYPQSAWAASLHLNLGLSYFATAYFSKAFTEYAAAWALSKTATDQHGRAIGDRSIAELLRLNARLGRYDVLEKLFNEIGNRPFHGNTMELVAGARSGFALMQQRPENAFRCGPAALDRILAHQNKTVGFNQTLMTSRSTRQGMSLTQVWKLAHEVGLDYQMAKRAPGAAVIAPAVVNWKVGHYAALISEQNGVSRVEDPTFGPDAYFATRAALDAEASGYFLVPSGPLPAGWQPVGEDEGSTVWGKGATTTDDPTRTRPYDPTTCPGGGGGGMPVASAQLMVCGLHLTDKPLFYTPPVGPSVAFTMTYNQREASQPTTFDYGNVGNLWMFGWQSYVYEQFTYAGGSGIYTFFNVTPTVHLMGGGTEPYPSELGEYTVPQYQMDSHAKLVKTDGNTYSQTNPDGSRYIYGFTSAWTVNPTTEEQDRRYFLTQIIDPAGNALTFSYDSSMRMVAVTDALGQVTTLSYNLASDPLKLTQVTDPFGRTTQLSYNANGQLSQMTDMLGLTSQFTYSSDGSDFITNMTTPYGASNFASGVGVNGLDRWLTMADPMGNTERLEYRDFLTSNVGLLPAGMNINSGGDYNGNTFYWDKHAYASWPDVNAAHDYHWMLNQINAASGDLENEKSALENNQVWYNYPGQTYAGYIGTSGTPSAIGRVLDDGTSQIYQYTYNSLGKILTTTDPLLRMTTYTYDQTNGIDLMEVDQSIGTTVGTTTGGSGGGTGGGDTGSGSGGSSPPPIGGTVPSGPHDVLATYTYNSQHEPLTATDASGQTTTYTYNSAGQVSTITDAKNEVTSYYYDPAGAANTTDSTKTGYLVAVVGPAVNSPTGPTTTFSYDGYGRVRTVTDSEGYAVTTDYDIFNRPTVITYPDGTTTQNIYDKLDLAQQIDRRGRVTQYRYNPLRQLVLVIDPMERNTAYDWCGCGALLSLTDPARNTTCWTYDLQGRKTAKIYPDQTTETYTYEATTSRLKSVTDAKAQVTNYKYNLDNSLNQISYTDTSGHPLVPATPTVSYFYDPTYLRITSMTDGIGTTNYAYNPVPSSPITTPVTGANQLYTVTGPLPNTIVSYQYDELGRATSTSIGTIVNDPANTSGVAYDALGRVTSAINPLGTFGYSYVNQTGRVAQIAYPNGQVTNYSYYPNSASTPGNDDQRLQSISNLSALNTNLSTYSYTYDPNGIIQTWAKQIDTASLLTSNFGYDSVDQLTSASVPSASSVLKNFNYIYDPAGNRTAEQIDSGVAAATVNNDNQITALSSTGPIHFAGGLSEPANVTVNGMPAKVDANNNFSADVPLAPGTNNVPVVATDGNGNTSTKTYQVTVTDSGVNRTLTYDANGNLTNDGAGKTYTYDAANRMVSITQASGVTGFAYDGFGHRVQETLNGTLIKQWVWCGGAQPCEERDGNNNVTKRFYAQGEQIALSSQPSTLNSYYFTHDHLGSVREMTDANGNLIARYDYDPFGRRTLVSGTDLADFGFTGDYFHAVSGLDLTLYRAYDANLGRWLSRDPIAEAGGINLYAYVLNNPVNKIDPLGLISVPIKGGYHPSNCGSSPLDDFLLGLGLGALAVGAFTGVDYLLGLLLGTGAAVESDPNLDEQLQDIEQSTPAPESPEISPSDLDGKTRSEIQDLADQKGLVPKGDPTSPDYPRKWSDPVTGDERLRLDRGHIDPSTGQPYDNPNAAVDHVHGYDPEGNPISVNGDNHIPTIGE